MSMHGKETLLQVRSASSLHLPVTATPSGTAVQDQLSHDLVCPCVAMPLGVADGRPVVASVYFKNCCRFLAHHSGVQLPPYRPC